MNRLIIGTIVSVVLIVLFLFGNFFYAFVNNIRLYCYLKKNNYERWRCLTMIGKFGPGTSNPLRWLPYIYGKEDNEDETVLRLKDNIRAGLRYIPVGLGAMIINIAIVATLIKKASG